MSSTSLGAGAADVAGGGWLLDPHGYGGSMAM